MKRVLQLFIFLGIIGLSQIANAQLAANFYVDTTVGGTSSNHGCSPVISTFHDISTGSPTAWSWVVTSPCITTPLTSTAENPTFVFTTGPCNYTVSLTVYNGTDSATTTEINYITVAVPPIIRFFAPVMADTVLACPGMNVSILNTSVAGGGGPSWTWYIGGDVDSAGPYNVKNLNYTFTNPGNYTITLIETDSFGCSSSASKTDYIKIDSTPVACFTDSNNHACSPVATVCFDNCSTGTNFTWHFGDGTSVIGTTSHIMCHNYTSSGTYSDTLIATSAGGCTNRIIKVNDIIISHFNPGFTKNIPTACAFSGISFQDTTFGSTHWLWNYHDMSSGDTVKHPAHVFSVAGTYIVTDSVWTDNGCSGVASSTVIVYPYPHLLSISGSPAYKCDVPDTVCFTPIDSGGTPPYRYIWSFGDAGTDSVMNPCHIYTSLGTFLANLTIKDTNSCTDSKHITITIATPSLSITATPDSGCTPLTVSLISNITPPGTPYIIDSVHWGDGTPTVTYPITDTIFHTIDTVTHLYTTGGLDVITLCYHLTSGCHYCVTTTVHPGAIHPDTPATITTLANYHIAIDSTCPNDSVRFHSNCPTCTSWEWYISDGNFPDSSFNHLYPNPGIYSVTLVDWKNGCNDTFKSYVYVFQPHDSFYVSLANCIDRKTYTFHDTSTGAVLYHWNFGDSPAGTSTAADPTYTYTAYGTYTVTEYITGAALHSCTDTYKYVLHVYPLSANFTANDTTACIGQSITFTGPTITGVGPYDSYQWYWGGGASSPSGSNITSHTYTADGIDTVRLIIGDIYGCTDTLLKPNYIRVAGASGNFTFSPAIGCVPDTVSFHDASTDLAGVTIVQRNWSFGDLANNLGNNINVTHTYGVGVWDVTLVDSDNAGCVISYTQTITATKPHADFSASSVSACPGLPIVFTNLTTFDLPAGDSSGTYIWHFGDGGTSTLLNPTHTYADTGAYTDTLIVISGHGCRDTMIKLNYVHIQHVAVAYNLSDTFASCPPLYVHMANVTTPIGAYTYQWKYGIGSDSSVINSTLTSPTYAYTYPGTYTITLIAGSAIGCKDSLKKTVHILGPTGVLTETPLNGCVPFVETFHIATSNTDTIYTWLPQGSAGYNTDTTGFAYTYTTVGNYVPEVVISADGCNVLVKSADTVKVHPVPVMTITDVPADGIICKGTTTILRGHATQVVHYLWTGVGLSCDTCMNTTVAPLGTSTYTVTGTTLFGCTDTAQFTVRVDTVPQIHIIGSDSLCLGQCDTLSATGVAHGHYTWTPNAGLLCTTCDTNIACPAHTTTYNIATIDTNNCKDSTSFTLTVNVPALFVQPVVVCDGYTTTIITSGAETYVWSPATGLSCTNCADPVTSVTSDITYTVTATDIHGCVDSVGVPVTVLDSTAVILGPNITICHGDVAQLSVTGPDGSTYLWTPTTNLSNANSSNPNATPDTTTAYIVTVTENQCFTVTDTETVIVDPVPDIVLPQTETIIAGSSVSVTANVINDTGLMYTWAPADNTVACGNCMTAILTPTMTTTTYTVTAVSNGGCKNDAAITITLRCDNSQVFVPNTFTPNGDGNNDRFYPSAKGVSIINKFSIYNRWGEMVFSAENIPPNSPSYGWDGTYKGQVLQPDVFVYIIDATCEVGDHFSFKGDISLVR